MTNWMPFKASEGFWISSKNLKESQNNIKIVYCQLPNSGYFILQQSGTREVQSLPSCWSAPLCPVPKWLFHGHTNPHYITSKIIFIFRDLLRKTYLKSTEDQRRVRNKEHILMWHLVTAQNEWGYSSLQPPEEEGGRTTILVTISREPGGC